MENREVTDVKRMISEFVGGVILYGMLFGIVYSIIALMFYGLFRNSTVIYTIISLLLDTIFAFIVYKYSIRSIFKKRTINPNDINDFIKKYIIVSIVIFLLSFVLNLFDVNSNINEAANSSTMTSMENVISKYYNNDQLTDYYNQKNELINEAKSKAYSTLIFTTIIFGVLYFIVVKMHIKTIEDYAFNNN